MESVNQHPVGRVIGAHFGSPKPWHSGKGGAYYSKPGFQKHKSPYECREYEPKTEKPPSTMLELDEYK